MGNFLLSSCIYFSRNISNKKYLILQKEVIMYWKTLIFFITLSTSQANARDNIKSYKDLSNLITTNDIKTIDELVDHLPERFKNGHTLIYETQALGKNLVSPARPRVLFFGTSGEFMMTINSHHTGGKAQAGDVEMLETIEFVGDKTFLRELKFDGVNSPLANKVEVNPKKCLECHGSDPRGLWDPYNMWPGVYGSLSRGRVDFISNNSREYKFFQTFLEEKKTNPRYSFIKHEYESISRLSATTKILIPYDPKYMTDALVIRDGHTTFPNQIIGMIIGDFNLQRLGRRLADAPKIKRDKVQYLIEAIRRDEDNFLAQPGFIDLKNFKFECSKNLADFLPEDDFQYESYKNFHESIMEMNALDHFRQKKMTGYFNYGLSGKNNDFDESDPFDFNIDLPTGPKYAPISLTHRWEKHFNGRLTASVLAYAFYLSGLPYQELSPAINAGRFNLYYGNSIECSGNLDNSGERKCFYHGVDIFFERFLSKKYFTDPNLASMSCNDLIMKSRESLRKL